MKIQIKTIYEEKIGLSVNDLPLKGVETTKIINALDLPRDYNKRLMIKAKAEYFEELKITYDSSGGYPSVQDFSWRYQPSSTVNVDMKQQANEFLDAMEFPSEVTSKSDTFLDSWMTQDISKHPSVDKKDIDHFFHMMTSSAQPAVTEKPKQRKTRPSNVAEPPSKKIKLESQSLQRPPLQENDSDSDLPDWLLTNPPPQQSICDVSFGSLAGILDDEKENVDWTFLNSIDYETLFD
jgi:hypothetical protein